MKIQTYLLAGIAALAMCLTTAQANIVFDDADAEIGLSYAGGLLDPNFSYGEWVGWSYGYDEIEGYYVYPTGGTPPTFTRTDTRPFKYDGAEFAGSGTLLIEGYLNNNLEGTITLQNLTDSFVLRSAISEKFSNVDKLVFSGSDWKMKEFNDVTVPVPEPTTILAGALLLLPFAAGAARSLRRARR